MVMFRARTGKVAIWEPPEEGNPFDPFNDPTAHMDLVRFHSDLQYLSSIAVSGEVDITHTLLAGVTGTGYTIGAGSGSSGSSPVTNGQARVTSIELYEHDLGYIPYFYVLYEGRIVTPGIVIQQPASNQVRMVSAYATAAKVFLRELAISSASDLPSADRTYEVFVFRTQDADPAKPTFHYRQSDGTLILGKGKITQDNYPIRRAVGAEPSFYVPRSRTLDIKGGIIRTISPIAGVSDFGTGYYTGGFTSADAIEVTI